MNATTITNYILNLGVPVMLPIFIIVFGLILRVSFGKLIRSAIFIGIAFIGINLVIGLLMNSLGPAAQAFVKNTGIQLSVMDVGWPVTSVVGWSTIVAPLIIPAVFILNIILLLLNWTRTLDIDIWNYCHFILTGSLIYYATHDLLISVLCACILSVIIFKLADWTQPVVEHYFGIPGVSLPHTETVGWAPLAFLINKIIDKIPVINKWNISPESIQKRLGVIGEPALLGLILGILLGILAQEKVSDILTLGMDMAAVMVLLPRMIQILIEGLMPVSEGAREFLQNRFPGRNVFIGMDAAIAIGRPEVIATSLLMVPITIALAVILPGNRTMPFVDLAVLPYLMIWAVAPSKGNVFRGLVTGTLLMIPTLYMASNIAELMTTVARSAGYSFPKNANLITSIDAGAHNWTWIMLRILQPQSPGVLIMAILFLALLIFSWWYMRKEIKNNFTGEHEADAE